MKTLPPAMTAALASGITTFVYCWRITRHDGAVLGFTEHDRDLTYAGTTFSASSGFTASQIEQSLGLSVDNMDAQGALSSAAITDADILAGRYDDAAVELFWVDWSDPSQGITVAAGNLGEIKRQGVAFSAEFRSIANRLNQKIGQTYERTCSATLGDSRCAIDLTAAAYRGTAIAQTAGLTAQIVVGGLSGYGKDWFSGGTLAFTAGANAGLTFEIKAHLRTAGADILELWLPAPFAVALGDTATVTAGCRKTFAVCRSKFDNHVNFRGFPLIPGTDVVTRYGVQGALGESGGSIYGT
ncbi:DUF2163 domain-containing protein [Lichenifustis flavocetrariae]|uniref:DUF2163 domain-containing protein n=1 Tax=Lichenifustis flavocetrariae TaxID=2949735 RepID=A0AA41YZH9_9HYPH|nr:DUF2163 domain-containing protein [Lichenifustis flavocetrariae]MCW6510989.1 DUF2163 domain-containing protein [Lichenifustis flavocetrariae]